MNTKTYSPRIIRSIVRTGSLIAVLASILVLLPIIVHAASVDLAWDANTESDLAGYKVHYGTASRNYSHSIDVGNTTEYTLTGLEEGVAYYMAATAYDDQNYESDYSSELVYTPPVSNHSPATPAVPDGPSSGYTQTNYTLTTSASDTDGDTLQIRYDWGDGSLSSWGASSRSHAWTSAGDFCIKAQAMDSNGASSGWSQCANMAITENTYTITASAGSNGSISPSGSITVNQGGNRTFAVSAATNYHIDDVLVDGASVGAISSYTFSSVSRNHTIQASFAINTHTITATAGSKGSISPSGNVTVNQGGNRTFAVSAATNYHIDDVLVDGASVGAVSSYRFANVTQNHTIQASFAINTHTIVASAGDGGSISPAGTVTINHGSNQTFTINPAENHLVADVLVNDQSVGAVTTYRFSNVINDGTIHVVFAADNQAPVADAGANQSARVHDTMHLDGSGSSDGDGNALTFKWSLTSRPTGSSATLTNDTAVNPTLLIDASGTYVARLIVNDGTIDSQPDTVIISTVNSPPTADAGTVQAVWIGDTVHLDGSGSGDADGDALSFSWSLISMPEGSTAKLLDVAAVKPTFKIDISGTYTAQLIVNDGTTGSQPDTVVISTENSAPLADAGADQSVHMGETVHLDGSGSSDADGDGMTFKWSLTSRPAGSMTTLSDATSVDPTIEIDVPGTYIAQLIVNDGMIAGQPDTVIITTENSPPAADAGANQAAALDHEVQLDGSGSSDADGDTLSFSWSLISLPAGSLATLTDATAVNPSFSIDIAGTYIAQLIVNDGTTVSHADTVSITTENSPPSADADADQTVSEGNVVTLSGLNSTDADDGIFGYQWEQTDGPVVNLTDANQAVMSFSAPNITTDRETLVFKLTVTDIGGLQAVDSCSVYVTKSGSSDGDGDGAADNGGDLQQDGSGSVDTDSDGQVDTVDTDSDNDGMPDDWELAHGLDPLTNDAADDFDGDEISNLDEYNQGSAPDQHESNLEPDSPQLLSPADYETVGLTPLLEAGEFYDSNANDVHDQTQWKILRAADQFCVMDVTTYTSLTSLRVPRLILEEDTDYIWQVRYIDNQGAASVWSPPGYFTTEFLSQDSDGNGVLDDQEVDPSADLDGDGVLDLDQTDIKSVVTNTGDFTVGISIRDAENADAVISVQSETAAETEVNYPDTAAPQFLAFGLIHFKLLVNEPGAEVLVTIHLSKRAYDDGIWYKYNPVLDEWQDYSDYTSFSADRKTAYLTLTDGGFGDADGIANGVIVDPLALRTATDHNSGSDSLVQNVAENLDPTGTCFISAAAGRRLPGLGAEIHARQMTFVLILIVLGYIGKKVATRMAPRYQGMRRKTSLMEGWRSPRSRE